MTASGLLSQEVALSLTLDTPSCPGHNETLSRNKTKQNSNNKHQVPNWRCNLAVHVAEMEESLLVEEPTLARRSHLFLRRNPKKGV